MWVQTLLGAPWLVLSPQRAHAPERSSGYALRSRARAERKILRQVALLRRVQPPGEKCGLIGRFSLCREGSSARAGRAGERLSFGIEEVGTTAGTAQAGSFEKKTHRHEGYNHTHHDQGEQEKAHDSLSLLWSGPFLEGSSRKRRWKAGVSLSRKDPSMVRTRNKAARSCPAARR